MSCHDHQDGQVVLSKLRRALRHGVRRGGRRIVKARGDKEHPLTKGYFCVKGMASVDLHNGTGADQRLKTSKKQLADGSFVDIDAEAALDEIALRLREIITTHGPAESGGLDRHHQLYGRWNAHDTEHAQVADVGDRDSASDLGHDTGSIREMGDVLRMGAFATGKRFTSQDLDASDAHRHQSRDLSPGYTAELGQRLESRQGVAGCQRNGTKLIVVDPRKTETARLADMHLQIIPGQDAALMAGLIKILLDNGWHDKEFCDRFVDHLDDLHRAVAEFDLHSVARRTGLPAHLIEETAQVLRHARKVSIGSGTGHNMASNCNLSEHLTEALNAICGGYRRAGEQAAAGFVNVSCAVRKRLSRRRGPGSRTGRVFHLKERGA